jgi:NADH-quinone oxidoreductase subunit L
VVFNSISRPLAWSDRHIIDGFMNLLATVSNRISVEIKGIQSGHIQQYAFVFLFATLVIAGILLFVV